MIVLCSRVMWRGLSLLGRAETSGGARGAPQGALRGARPEAACPGGASETGSFFMLLLHLKLLRSIKLFAYYYYISLLLL